MRIAKLPLAERRANARLSSHDITIGQSIVLTHGTPWHNPPRQAPDSAHIKSQAIYAAPCDVTGMPTSTAVATEFAARMRGTLS